VKKNRNWRFRTLPALADPQGSNCDSPDSGSWSSSFWRRQRSIRYLKPVAALLLGAALLSAPSLVAFSPHRNTPAPASDFAAVGEPIPPAPVDPAIRRALGQISTTEIQQSIATLVSFNNRSTLSSMRQDLRPGEGVNAAADWIEAQFQKDSAACGGCLEVKRDAFTEQPQSRIPQPTLLTNVYAVLRGKDAAQSKRMYLVTGHYDSRNSSNENTRDPAPGANDDASGVAVSLACARVLSRMQFPATLVFVAVAGEEQGLNGSRHLARFARSQGWELEGVLNNDIVGGDTTPGDKFQDKHRVRVFSEAIPEAATPDEVKRIEAIGGENDSPSRQLARAIAAVARTYFNTDPTFRPVLEFRHDRFLRGGDHTSFNQEGFTAVRLTEWRENFDHQHQNVRTENGVQYGDLISFVDFSYTANVARLNAATLASLASAPGAPQNVRMLTAALGNNTALTWSSPAGAPPGTTYDVIWRETSAPDWQYVALSAKFGDAPKQEQDGSEHHAVTVPISKDNVVFGVRSVDPAGHCSLVVTPVVDRSQ
jgi:Peptidase family M28